MEEIVILVTNEPSLRFVGKKIGFAYSGALDGRWRERVLYITKGDNFVCHKISRTGLKGERDRFTAKVCKTHKQIVSFFGYNELAKEIYAQVGIEIADRNDEHTD